MNYQKGEVALNDLTSDSRGCGDLKSGEAMTTLSSITHSPITLHQQKAVM